MYKYFIVLFFSCSVWASSSFNWNSSTTLSDPGEINAPTGQIVSNNVDGAIAIWSRYENGNWLVEATYSTNDGKNWYNPDSEIVSGAQLLPNPSPIVVLNDNNAAIVVFVTFEGLQYKIREAYSIDGGQNWTTPRLCCISP